MHAFPRVACAYLEALAQWEHSVAMKPSRRIVVIIGCQQQTRCREALRAALGLGLRRDHVHVVLTAQAGPWLSGDPEITRALQTLAELGYSISNDSELNLGETLRNAHVIEHWT